MPATNVAWGGATLTVMVGGVDVSCEVLRCTVDRSKNRLWDPPDAGTCQLELDLTNNGVPSNLGAVGATVTVKIAYAAVTRFLFSGEVQRRQPRVDPQGDTLTLDCVDGFEKLSRLNLRAATTDTPVGGGEAIQQRIARWLNAAGWPSGARALDTSDFTAPATLMDGNVLLQIQAAALADGGDFYIDGDGIAVFRSWNWHTTGSTAEALFSDRRQSDWVPYSSASVTDDLDEVQNRVYGTRRKINDTDTPATLVADNAASVTTYGERGDALDDLELSNDTQVSTRITNLVAVAGGPNARFDSIVVQPAFDPTNSWPRTIPVTFSSLIAANRLWEDGLTTSLFGHVIGEQWSFTPDDATVEYRVSGTGTWDGTRPPRPPPKVVINENGCLQIPEGYPCDDINEVVTRDASHTVLDVYPPGSLCFPNEICDYDPNTTEVCFRDAAGNAACYAIDDPRLAAILWVDVRTFGPPPTLIERIEETVITAHPSLDHATAAVVPGVDAMCVDVDGGVVAAGTSGRLTGVDLTTGWTVDFWLSLGGSSLPPASFWIIIELQTIQIKLTTEYDTAGPTKLEVVTWNGGVAHLSGPLANLNPTGWHHYIVQWDSANLFVIVDGTEV